MKYYRLIIKKNEDGLIVYSDIVEQSVDDEMFESMNWEKPLVIHNDGKHIHFMSLVKEYLECLITGVGLHDFAKNNL